MPEKALNSKMGFQRVWWAITGLVPLLLVLGCGQDSTPNDNPKPALSQTEKPVTLQDPGPVATPVQPVTPETKKTYQYYCAQCHGLKGKGDGINAAYLTVPPRDHTKADYMETRTDEQLFTAIKEGGLSVGRAPCMPRWGHTLNDETIHSLVAYIRELCQCQAL